MLKRAYQFFIGLYGYQRGAKKISFSMEQKKSQEDLAIELLERWLAKHPRPDEKVLWVGDQLYSSREMVEEVKSRSPMGVDYLHGLIQVGLRIMLHQFTEGPAKK